MYQPNELHAACRVPAEVQARLKGSPGVSVVCSVASHRLSCISLRHTKSLRIFTTPIQVFVAPFTNSWRCGTRSLLSLLFGVSNSSLLQEGIFAHLNLRLLPPGWRGTGSRSMTRTSGSMPYLALRGSKLQANLSACLLMLSASSVCSLRFNSCTEAPVSRAALLLLVPVH